MSGICGIFNLDGRPVDRRLLQDMTDFMAFRGPDAQDIWIDGPVGFGHTLLRTTFESENEHQPCSLDGQVWITTDARIDGQSDLKKKLKDKGCRVLEGCTDSELILHAYTAWREGCLDHLIGDFAFAIWDGRRQRFFCARDPFGVKLFYYARTASSIIFSNTLNSVRRHPAVSDKLNDHAIADFLLFDYNQDPATTTFADIQRLPPAHCLTCADGSMRVNRYWSLQVPKEIYYPRGSDYIDHFRALLRTAVSDRLRTNSIGISMSGGLDSSSIAATAYHLLKERGQPFNLRAQTVVYDKLIPDEERRYAGLVAAKLAIPIDFIVADHYQLYERQDEAAMQRPEPVHAPTLALFVDELKQFTSYSRVVLTGWDGDAILNESPKLYLRRMLKGFKVKHFSTGLAWFILHRRNQTIRNIAHSAKRKLLRKQEKPWPHYPAWLNRSFADHLDAPARWEHQNALPSQMNPIRPYAYHVLTSTNLWLDIFEWDDAGVNSFQLEFRYPFLDLRLVEFCLGLPAIPWCINKELLRAAMQDVLPEPVRLRPKTPLAGDHEHEMLRRGDTDWPVSLIPPSAIDKYVDRDAMPGFVDEADPVYTWINLRPFSLNRWLKSLDSKNIRF